ncbi:MAG TPA: GntR family transcriptional regulator [Sulfurovum sp. UBA12169]|nr:MAG TPA: GntR family transcriptional regulator [Sulfurovum sp. UBA12169]
MHENMAKLMLRVMVGGLMLFHGIHKATHGIAPIKGMLAAHHFPEMLGYGIYVGEILAPIFLIIGWKSRWWAGIIAMTMVGAIYLAHSKDIFAINAHGAWMIELPILFLISSLAIVLLGSGKYAIIRD